MTKAAHDPGCGARSNNKCNCMSGTNRRIKKRAQKALKRQRQKIAEKTGLPYEDTLVEVHNKLTTSQPNKLTTLFST